MRPEKIRAACFLGGGFTEGEGVGGAGVEQGVEFYGLFGVHVADAESAVASRSRVSFFIVSGGAGFGEESIKIGGGTDGRGALQVGKGRGMVAGDHIVVA